MSQFLRSSGDVSQDGDWERVPVDGAVLWNTIDEASFNDADYIWHNAAAQADQCLMTLSGVDTPSIGAGTIRMRIKRLGGAKTTDIEWGIFQGETRKFYGYGRITDEWVTEVDSVVQLSMDAITDWTDLSIRFYIQVAGGGQAADPAISWFEFEVPDAAGAGYHHGLKVQGVGELALCDVGNNPLRFRKGGITRGIELVATDDPNASAIRIKTPSGIKAIRKYT